GVTEDQLRAGSAGEDPDGTRPRIYFQQVPEDKTVKNRVHLDVQAAPGMIGEERMTALVTGSERLVGRRATRMPRFERDAPHSGGFIVMADPEGNEFCLD